MQTTCPECRTTFRVSQDHLGARRGLVRCGTCNAVFNAYDTLLPELESPPDDGLPEGDHKAAEESAPSDAVYPVDASPQPDENPPASVCIADDAVLNKLVEVPPSDNQAERGLSEPVADASAQSEADALPVVEVPTIAASAVEKAQADILYEPVWSQPAKSPRTWKFWLYLVLALLLAALLGLQAAYFLRAELAAAVPISRPALEALCRPLNCSVPLPRQLTQTAIAASSLEHDPENKSRVRLTFLLTNRSGQTQAWPQITLTLSDVRQAPVAQQVFRPQTYLPKNVKIAAGMAADVEREIRLDLDIGNLVASGYALSLSYP